MRVLTTTTTASTTAASCSSLPSGDYEFSAAKAKAAKDAVDRRRHEEGKRRAYEERMARKAKREGRPPDYYLQKGEDMDSWMVGWVAMTLRHDALMVLVGLMIRHCYLMIT